MGLTAKLLERQANARIEENLRKLREGDRFADTLIKELLVDLKEVGKSLEDVGVTEADLQRFKELSHRVIALGMLQTLRKPRKVPQDPQRKKRFEEEDRKWRPHFVRDIRLEAQRGGFDLPEIWVDPTDGSVIGTTEEELASLAKRPPLG